jgi:hypothetical protein
VQHILDSAGRMGTGIVKQHSDIHGGIMVIESSTVIFGIIILMLGSYFPRAVDPGYL